MLPPAWIAVTIIVHRPTEGIRQKTHGSTVLGVKWHPELAFLPLCNQTQRSPLSDQIVPVLLIHRDKPDYAAAKPAAVSIRRARTNIASSMEAITAGSTYAQVGTPASTKTSTSNGIELAVNARVTVMDTVWH